MANRYDDVLKAIADGRKLTKDMVTGDPSDQRVELGDNPADLSALHEQIQQADTSKPGWIARLLGGGS